MGKNKWARFQENAGFSCLYQPDFEEVFAKDWHLKGRWNREVFGRTAPICLELGCGKGEYTLALAQKYPERHFIGIDIKGARLWRGAKTATELSLSNVAFIRTRIECIASLFAPNEIHEIWITFPDPQIQKERKRLTHPMFLERYRKFLRPHAAIHLKTDSRLLYDYSLHLVMESGYPVLHADPDIYGSGLVRQIDILGVQTFYEKQYLAQGKPITYLSFRLN
ncbi:MAG: tRNA (guanosine(46)-N7)-methyltransferase TrmB [Bacteroidales bacterium]|nr:tRNA (guanosine(46)-N7)-methyltransferase TrmB [Bacteroidales bacterium]